MICEKVIIWIKVDSGFSLSFSLKIVKEYICLK